MYDSYQWFYNFSNSNTGGTPWPGGTGQSINVGASEWALTYFYVEATSDGCTEPSATLNWDAWVFNAPSISSSGQSQYCIGDSTEISNAFNGPIFFRWFRDGLIIPGATASSYFVKESGTYTLSAAYGECPDYWQSSGVGLTFNFIAPIVPIITESGGTLFSDSGSDWQWILDVDDIAGATSSSYVLGAAGNYQVRVTDINGCTALSDPFKYLGPLPIELINLSAKINSDCEAFVNWEVSKSSTAKAFGIEYSNDGNQFNEINIIETNDRSQTLYQQKIEINQLVYLRIRMHDIDGSITYSPLRFLEFDCGSNIDNVFKFYPNPATNNFTIQNLQELEVVISIFDLNGRLIIEKRMNNSSVDFNLNNWNNGFYQV